MKTRFVGGEYNLPTAALSSETAVNIYPEPKTGSPGAEAGQMLITPGLLPFFTPASPASNAVVRATFIFKAKFWWLAGNTVYFMSSALVPTQGGTVPSAVGDAYFHTNGVDLIVADSSGWTSVDPLNGATTVLSGNEYPRGQHQTVIDGRIVFTRPDGTFGWTRQVDVTDPDPLAFRSAEGLPDDTIGLAVLNKQLWAFGTISTEIFDSTTDIDNPFVPAGTAFIENGCASRNTIVEVDNSLIWLTRDRYGDSSVVLVRGYTPERVSNYAIDTALNNASTLSNAYADVYKENGHLFYLLTVPALETTFCYDVATGEWHRRENNDVTTGLPTRWPGLPIGAAFGKVFVGSYNSATLFEQTSAYAFYGSINPILFERTWNHIEDERKRIAFDQLELVSRLGIGDGATFDNPPVSLSWSNDGGVTFGLPVADTLGAVGVFKRRVQWNRLGTSRSRVFRLSGNAYPNMAFLGANVKAEVLDS